MPAQPTPPPRLALTPFGLPRFQPPSLLRPAALLLPCVQKSWQELQQELQELQKQRKDPTPERVQQEPLPLPQAKPLPQA